MLGIIHFVFWPIVGVFVWWFVKYFRYEQYLKHFPGPTPLPLIGNALEFSSSATILDAFLRYHRKYKGSFRIYIAFEPMLIVCDQKLIECILSSSRIIEKSKHYKYLYNWLGEGLLTGSGNRWKKHRKIIAPAFHLELLEKYVSVFDSASETLVEKLSSEIGNESTDIFPYITLHTLDVICESTMGTSLNAQENKESAYVKSVHEMGRIITDRGFSPTQQYDMLYYFTKNYRIEKAALKVLHDYSNLVIQERKKHFLSKNIIDLNSENETKCKMAFLDLMLNYRTSEGDITNEQLREEVDTFLFAGHDTTAAAISFALYCLANNPDIQSKVYDEMQDILSNSSTESLKYRDLQEMKYLEAVIKETLRLYPSVPVIGRALTEDVEFDGKVIPKGMSILISPFTIHRDPDIYTDPEKFDPERFFAGNAQQSSTYEHIPFSAGPRNCIGQKFAMLEMKATISKVIKNYELLPVDYEICLKSDTVLKATNGIQLRLKKRT